MAPLHHHFELKGWSENKVIVRFWIIELSNRDEERSWNWISLPHHEMDVDGDGEYTALDIVEQIEGDRESSEIINSIARYNRTRPLDWSNDPYYCSSYFPIMNYTDGGWETQDDFKIRIGDDALGLNTTANHTWFLSGVENEAKEIHLYDISRQYISVPYTYHDIAKNKKIDTFDIVKDIEGNLSSSDKIQMVFDWDFDSQGYTNYTSYSGFTERWHGELTFQPGDVFGFHVLKNFAWTPTLFNHQPPTVKNIEQNTSHISLDSNLTIEFTETMNTTSVTSNIYSDSFDFTTYWINDRILEIIPDDPFEPETEYTLQISNQAKDIYGNHLDGDSNGIAEQTSEDDYTLNFISATYPTIEHDPPSRWHIDDDIELSAEIEDDTGLKDTYINYTQTDGSNHNVSLDTDDTNISIPAQNQSGTFSYYYWAVDEDGLGTKSNIYTLEILDLSTPEIENTSFENATVPINGNLTVEFSKPMNQTSIKNSIDITPDVDFVLEFRDEYSMEINITDASPETEYTLTVYSDIAEDIHGVRFDSDKTIDFTSESPPEIFFDQELDTVYKSSNISISANITDEFGVENVFLEYTGPTGITDVEHLSNEGINWTGTIPRQNRTGQLTYRFIAVDQSGLTTESEDHSIDILDPTEVWFDNITGETEDPLEFEVEITNPVGIREVELYYEENGQETREELMLTEGNAGDGTWSTQIDIDSEGEYEYSIVITDLDGETSVKNSPNSIVVDESSSLFSNIFLYILPLLAIAAAVGGILYYKRGNDEDTFEEEDIDGKSTETASVLHEHGHEEERSKDNDEDLCTICFGKIQENVHTCSGCGKRYHRTCITALGECPICGDKSIVEKGVDDDGKE
ncbi:MAG: Ig-like domain-containing protein [Candidatus Saliniplasma sp.]